MGNEVTVIPVNARLVTTSGTYQIQGMHVRFQLNGVPVCVVNLAVGRNTAEPNEVVDINFERGDSGRIFVENLEETSTAGNFTYNRDSYQLFDGVIDDFGPGNLTFGAFTVQVRLYGRLSFLASGTLESSNIVPKSHMDTAVYWAYGQGAEDNPNLINIEEGRQNFGNALLDALENTAAGGGDAPTNSVTEFVQDTFGGDYNAEALNVLRDITSNLIWNQNAQIMSAGTIAHINELMQSQWSFASFFQRLVMVGEMLRFSVIEDGQGIYLVPHIPFFNSTDATRIYAETYSQFQWDTSNEYRNYGGCVLVDGGGSAPIDTSGSIVAGHYKMPGLALGQVHVGTIPGFLAAADSAMITGSDGERARSWSALAENTTTDRLAKVMTWELNYRNRKFRVDCPFFRSDIAVGEAVAVEFPNVEEIRGGTEGAQIFGTVDSIDIIVDATRGSCSTTFTVDYSRSYRQQDTIIAPDYTGGEHPFWADNYIGGRLDTEELSYSSRVG